MTFQDDPNIPRRHDVVDANTSSTGMWIAGAAAVMLVLGLIAYSASDRTNVASSDRPAASSPASTTGSGATSPPSRGDAGSAPTRTPTSR